ncbi:hypothetical protein DFH27DRAFT_525632 [Peziza echinospora]|nr:hypothetical protein DFH27DRAFT_525632 [Peziza echinospora]
MPPKNRPSFPPQAPSARYKTFLNGGRKDGEPAPVMKTKPVSAFVFPPLASPLRYLSPDPKGRYIEPEQLAIDEDAAQFMNATGYQKLPLTAESAPVAGVKWCPLRGLLLKGEDDEAEGTWKRKWKKVAMGEEEEGRDEEQPTRFKVSDPNEVAAYVSHQETMMDMKDYGTAKRVKDTLKRAVLVFDVFVPEDQKMKGYAVGVAPFMPFYVFYPAHHPFDAALKEALDRFEVQRTASPMAIGKKLLSNFNLLPNKPPPLYTDTTPCPPAPPAVSQSFLQVYNPLDPSAHIAAGLRWSTAWLFSRLQDPETPDPSPIVTPIRVPSAPVLTPPEVRALYAVTDARAKRLAEIGKFPPLKRWIYRVLNKDRDISSTPAARFDEEVRRKLEADDDEYRAELEKLRNKDVLAECINIGGLYMDPDPLDGKDPSIAQIMSDACRNVSALEVDHLALKSKKSRKNDAEKGKCKVKGKGKEGDINNQDDGVVIVVSTPVMNNRKTFDFTRLHTSHSDPSINRHVRNFSTGSAPRSLTSSNVHGSITGPEPRKQHHRSISTSTASSATPMDSLKGPSKSKSTPSLKTESATSADSSTHSLGPLLSTYVIAQDVEHIKSQYPPPQSPGSASPDPPATIIRDFAYPPRSTTPPPSMTIFYEPPAPMTSKQLRTLGLEYLSGKYMWLFGGNSWVIRYEIPIVSSAVWTRAQNSVSSRSTAAAGSASPSTPSLATSTGSSPKSSSSASSAKSSPSPAKSESNPNSIDKEKEATEGKADRAPSPSVSNAEAEQAQKDKAKDKRSKKAKVKKAKGIIKLYAPTAIGRQDEIICLLDLGVGQFYVRKDLALDALNLVVLMFFSVVNVEQEVYEVMKAKKRKGYKKLQGRKGMKGWMNRG